MFSKQDLICCICGIHYEAAVADSWHAFEKAVCGARCFYEKQWREYLSQMNKPYRLDTKVYDEAGRPIKEEGLLGHGPRECS